MKWTCKNCHIDNKTPQLTCEKCHKHYTEVIDTKDNRKMCLWEKEQQRLISSKVQIFILSLM